MKFRLALVALVSVCLINGSVYAVTTGTNAPTPAAQPQDETPANDSATNDPADPNAVAPEADQNPYSAIIKANVFQLKEPPPPPKHDDPAILNLPKVNITGFRKRDDEPVRALFATVPKDPKDNPKYFNLAEGEKEDILELKHIDPNQEFVDVIIAGTPTTLTVKSNSFVQPISIPKAGGPVGIVARPPQPMAPPVAYPATPGVPAAPSYNNQSSGGVVVAGGNGGNTAIPGATVTSYGNNQPNVPNPLNNNPGIPNNGAAVAPNAGESSALRSIPTRSGGLPQRDIRTPGGFQPPQPQ